MNKVDFRQVDVFTSIPFQGNPVAVVMDARFLSESHMQAIARWTNLSETTFVLPAENPKAAYKVRIFTPESELPFAGHPTIGTAHALLEAGKIAAEDGKIIQECGAGLIKLMIGQDADGIRQIAFELPEPIITLLDEQQTEKLEKILGCRLDRTLTPALVDVGARWIVAHAYSAAEVLETEPDFSKLYHHDREMGITGVCLYGAYPTENQLNIEVRSFAPACGVNEDPVCGSGNGSVAAFLRYHNTSLPADKRITSSQGKRVGRNGKITLSLSDGKIMVGGSAVTCISGSLYY